MCGISLILDPASSSQTIEQLSRMHAAIRHRGPDEERFLVVEKKRANASGNLQEVASHGAGHVAAAFRRLRILDLSERASQPMTNAEGSHWILFNGEIYNHTALRDELSSHFRFRSQSDTEVILAAYGRWGNACWPRLHGMWAVVIIDLDKQRLVVSRDRFGIKPLLWSVHNRRLLLASEARQIVAALGGRPAANRELVRSYLEGIRFPLVYETFFEGIHPFPQGCFAELDLGKDVPQRPSFQSYYELPVRESEAIPYEKSVDRLEALLRDVVSSHAVADVTVGSLLSGGLDSSLLAVMLADHTRASGADPPTYSFGLLDAPPEYQELTRADRVAQMHHLRNRQASFDAAWVARHADDVVRTIEEPPLGMPVFAQYRIFQLCREDGTTVVLDGQASDELFGGYPYHSRLYLRDRLRRRDWNGFLSVVRAMSRKETTSFTTVLLRELGSPFFAKLGVRLNGAAEIDWIHPDYGRRTNPRMIEEAFRDRGESTSSVQQRIYWDVKWGNVRLILDYADRNSMAASIESRVPYLDDAIVEFALATSDQFKVGNGERKRVLRDVGRRMLPRSTTEEVKRVGFYTPQNEMLSGELRHYVEEALEDDSLLASGAVDTQRVEMLKRRFFRGDRSQGDAIWRLWMLVIWSRQFDVALS